jgi:hypothetical protein
MCSRSGSVSFAEIMAEGKGHLMLDADQCCSTPGNPRIDLRISPTRRRPPRCSAPTEALREQGVSNGLCKRSCR